MSIVPSTANHHHHHLVARGSCSGQVSGSTTRLLDHDANKFRSLKRVIVIFQRPESGTGTMSEALKMLGFKVYDFEAASDRYERDFALWAEAARLRNQYQAYNQSDYDKVIGDHNALVGPPVSQFGTDFLQLYPGVKIIMISDEVKTDKAHTMLRNLKAWLVRKVMTFLDAPFFGNLDTIGNLTAKIPFDRQAIRECVSKNNLLEIDKSLDVWNPICDFLKLPVPKHPMPRVTNDIVAIQLSLRTKKVLRELANTCRAMMMQLMQTICAIAGAFVIAWIADRYHRPITHDAIVPFALIVLCFFVFFSFFFFFYPSEVPVNPDDGCGTKRDPMLDTVSRIASAVTVKPTAQQLPKQRQQPLKPKRQSYSQDNRYPPKARSSQKHGNHNQVRAERANRPPPPALSGWTNFQATINMNDQAQYAENMAAAKKLEGQRITFNQKYKETKSNSCKIVAVSEERLE